jgi:alpha-galactosidase
MPTITLIGAGSTVFAKTLIGDILRFPELSRSTLRLHDIDVDRLQTSAIVARKTAEALGADAEIETSIDLSQALEGADYALCLIQVGGYKPSTIIDFEIPKRFGLRQTIADTLGIGGIMRALRTIPVLLDICRAMESLCPDALFINYTNPMSMNCMALDRSTSIKTIGLCHSVQATLETLARDIQVPKEEIESLCAGINHMAFFLKLEHQGQDLYPLVQKVVDDERVPADNRVRYEVFQRLGYFVTESSEHFSEYVPWFIKRDRPDLIGRYNIPLDEYLHRCEEQIAEWDTLRERLMDPASEVHVEQSHEYGANIIHSQVTGQSFMFNGNVRNRGLIDNLPLDSCVEVPCRVDGQQIQPQPVGHIPPQLAALMQTNINVQTLTVEAALTGKREHIYHAAMLDPHTAAELDLDQIVTLVEELIDAHGEMLPEFL